MSTVRKYRKVTRSVRRRRMPKNMYAYSWRDGFGVKHRMGSYELPAIRINRTVHDVWTVTPGQFNGLALTFALNALPNANELNMFDQYKITGILLKIFPRQNVSWTAANGSGANYNQGELLFSVDYDDAVIPADENAICQRSTCQSVTPFKPIEIFLRPKPAGNVFGAAATGYSVLDNTWLNMANQNVPHYGVKLGMKPGGTASDPKLLFDFTAKYYIHLRCPQ